MKEVVNQMRILSLLLGCWMLVGTCLGEETLQPSAATSQRVLDFRAVHRESQQPLANVSLTISVNGGNCSDNPEWIEQTDAQGHCLIQLRGELWHLMIAAEKTGFVPAKVNWSAERQPMDLPAEYLLSLEPGTSIGGIVENEAGELIASATVHLSVSQPQVNLGTYPITTDKQGRWRCDAVPAKIEQTVGIRLEHPDYVSDSHFRRAMLDQLRKFNDVQMMKKGLALSGRVQGPTGQPIADATVVQGADRFGSHYPETKTDNNGDFRFAHVEPDTMVLTVTAPGFAPAMKTIDVTSGMQLDFQLEPGRAILGRIQDNDGNPIDGAIISADTWQQHRALEWRTESDADGGFYWDSAPPDSVLVSIRKNGFMSVRKHELKPSNEEPVITMYRPLTISGTVVDADTSQPITSFQVVRGGEMREKGQIWWDRKGKLDGTGGEYEIRFREPSCAHLIAIEAAGYQPAVSRPFQDDEGEVVFDFRLRKGVGPSGIVQSADGKPLAYAKVVLATDTSMTTIKNGKDVKQRDNVVTETGTDGRFALPAQFEDFSILILHDEGFTEITAAQLTASAVIALTPWGGSEGAFRIGSKPASNRVVGVLKDEPFSRKRQRFDYLWSTTTDGQGRFRFERLFPGRVLVSGAHGRSGPGGTEGWDHLQRTFHSEFAEIKSGQTALVNLGGMGRPIVGHVIIRDNPKMAVNWNFADGRIDQMPDLSLPLDQPLSVRQKRTVEWEQSEAGKQFFMMKRFGSFTVNSDGTFQIDDVPEGKYYLSINLYNSSFTSLGAHTAVGKVIKEFVVPKIASGRSDESLDLGLLEMEIR